MKKQILSVFALLFMSYLTFPVMAMEDNGSGFGCILGYKGFSLEGTEFKHDTHPSDSFLPSSNVPGSAGTTSLSDEISSYFAFGLRYQAPIVKDFNFSFDLGGLYGGQRDCHQNDNDYRSKKNGSIVC